MQNKVCIGCSKSFSTYIHQKKYCSAKCGWSYYSWNRWRTNEDYRKKRKEYNKQWYEKNKKRHFENIYKHYRKNKGKWNERRYVNKNKQKVWDILGKKCKDCGEEAIEVNHLKYDFPKRSYGIIGGMKKKQEYLIEYCKFLEPLCRPCHRKRSRIIK